MKYPILTTYIHTEDDGQELRTSLRSLQNITNWSGKLFVVGDSEKWFKNISYIKANRIHGKPYKDQIQKIKLALSYMPEVFIISQDDIYICTPTTVGVYYLGELTNDVSSFHKRTKKNTKELLEYMGLPTLDYECHTPILVEKDKLLETLYFILDSGQNIQWRSVYGNMWNVKAELFEDKKTKTSHLKRGNIISTNFYTNELVELFPEPCIFES